MAKLSSQSSVIIVSYLCVLVVITLVQQSVVIVYAADDVSEANVGVQDGRSQFCSIDLASFLPPPYGNLSYSSCHPVWETFVLRVSIVSPWFLFSRYSEDF